MPQGNGYYVQSSGQPGAQRVQQGQAQAAQPAQAQPAGVSSGWAPAANPAPAQNPAGAAARSQARTSSAAYAQAPAAATGYGQGSSAGAAYAPAGSYYPQQPPQDPRTPKKRWPIVLAVVLALLALLGIGIASCTASVASMASFGTSSTSFEPNTVAVINMGGTIQYDGTENSPEGLKSLLDEAEENDNVKAVVLRVNSGGGVAAAGEEMSIYLQKFEKPVVVSSAAINASAAYMISAQSDYIYVLNSTDIGSIGTIMQHYDLSELLAKLGVNIENIKSADSKDSSYYNRPLTDEERAEYQHQVDVINNNFIRLVAEGRDMSEDQVRALADGSTKVGQESVDAGLADGIGTFDDACKKAAELADLGDDYEVGYLSLYENDLSTLMGIFGSTDDASAARLLAQTIERIEESNAVAR